MSQEVTEKYGIIISPKFSSGYPSYSPPSGSAWLILGATIFYIQDNATTGTRRFLVQVIDPNNSNALVDRLAYLENDATTAGTGVSVLSASSGVDQVETFGTVPDPILGIWGPTISYHRYPLCFSWLKVSVNYNFLGTDSAFYQVRYLEIPFDDVMRRIAP